MDEEIRDITFLSPGVLRYADVALVLEKTTGANPRRGWVPAYTFGIYEPTCRTRLGRISFRVGDTRHVHLYAGHIGYGVDRQHRGHGYAAKACMALRPLIRHYYSDVIITCDPDNAASVRTIEKMGGEFLECVPVPPDHPFRTVQGSVAKNRYRWRVD
jgi:tagatose 1,6-diphosphate aldolase